ncbi:hypothetical protein LguiB_028169 [Lonicera macranthoides]
MDRRNPSYAKAVRRNTTVRREKSGKAIFQCQTQKEAEEIEEDRAWFSTRSNAIVLKKWNPKETRKSWQAHKIRKGNKPTITIEEDNVTEKETKDEDTKTEVDEDEDISKGEMIKDKYSYDEGEIIGRARVGNNGVVWKNMESDEELVLESIIKDWKEISSEYTNGEEEF